MRASSSWIKLQFVVRKHVMNTYQMHTLSLFLFYHIFYTSLSPSALSLIFLSFWLYPPSLQLIPSLFFWWSVILIWHIQLCCIMYPCVCICVCICVCSHILGLCAYICDMCLGVLSVSVMKCLCVCHSFFAIYYHISLSQTTCMCFEQVCVSLHVYLLCLCIWCSYSPYHRPLWQCSHLEGVAKRAWCISVNRGRPGYFQTDTSCMDQPRRWQPIWGYSERDKDYVKIRKEQVSKEVAKRRMEWGQTTGEFTLLISLLNCILKEWHLPSIWEWLCLEWSVKRRDDWGKTGVKREERG